jgi:hypothetical protein
MCPPLKASEFNVQYLLEDMSLLKAAEFNAQNLFNFAPVLLPMRMEFKVYTLWEKVKKDTCCNV